MNSRTIRVLAVVVLFVFGWAGTALAGEVCDKFPTAPGARVIVVGNPDQLAEAVGDPESLFIDVAGNATARPGDFVCILVDMTIDADSDGAGSEVGPGTAVNITIPGITIYGALNPATGARARLTAGTGLTAAIFEVGATAAQMATSGGFPPYLAAPFFATGNPDSVVITDPIFDCAGISGTAITVLPGANNTVIEQNTIGGLTGACAVAGVLVEADNYTGLGGDPGPGGQTRFDADGDGLLENTTGTRIRANVFDAVLGASGPAIILEENVLGNPDPNVGALEDQPPFEQCTTAGLDTVHTVVGDPGFNAADSPPPTFSPRAAPLGNTIVSTGAGSWTDGIESEGSHICIRGNLISATAAGDIAVDAIQLLAGANGNAVWGNVIVSAVANGIGDDAIHVMGPFKLGSVTPDGDSLYDNVIGRLASTLPAFPALFGAVYDGVVCEDERIYIRGSVQGAQRAISNGDEGFDMTGLAPGDGEGFGCTKRDAVSNNDAIGNGDNGFEGGTDYVDNDASGNTGHGFLVPGGATATFPFNRFCGNVAVSNGARGFFVGSRNLFTNAPGPYGSATCARGGNFAVANGSDGFNMGGENVFEPALVVGTPTIAGSPVHFAWCNADDGVEMGTGAGVALGGDANRVRRVSAQNNKYSGFLTTAGSDDNHLSNNTAGSLAVVPPTTIAAACTPPGYPANAPAPVAVPVGANDQDYGWYNAGGTPALPNRAWRNTFGDSDFESATALGATFTGNGVGVFLAGGHVVLEESTGTLAFPVNLTVQADLDGNDVRGEACNVITNNTSTGLYVATGVSAALQQIDDEDGQGGIRLSQIYEQIGDAEDLENDDSTSTLVGEGLWSLVTVGPTPDVTVGPSWGVVQVSSTRVHELTTVTALLTNCAVEVAGGGRPTPPRKMAGDVNLSGSFEQADVDLARRALRKETTLDQHQFDRADVARPCGRLTRADINRLRASLRLIARGRSGLASQCGDRPIIGASAAPTAALRQPTETVRVYDISGRLLFEERLGPQVALSRAQRELANGVYLAVIATANGQREVRKFIVLR